MSLNSRGNEDVATGWSRSNFYAIFSVNRYAYCVWLLHKYEAHMKGLPICFSEVQVKNDVTDNNNKHFVTAFEGECRNIIELREHLKLCFLIILARVVSRPQGRLSVASIYGIYIYIYSVMAGYTLMQVFWCWRLSVRLSSGSLARPCSLDYLGKMSITFCFKSTFCRQIVSCFKYFLIK